MNRYLKSALFGGACAMALATSAFAGNFNIPNGDLETALDAFSAQTGIELIVSGDAVNGAHTKGAKGVLTANEALTRILTGTGFVMQPRPSGAIAIVHGAAETPPARAEEDAQEAAIRLADASSGIESVVVTSSKIKGDIQTVPIAITALSQEQLTARQIAGGPDLVKEVPNLTFTKTNFSGYNLEIRGIGTQAISVTTDPAVAVAFNDTPFIRNHFFEQEFYDVSQVEVLRGPQGTLYGRNATAGVVNLVSAKPTDQFEAMASADFGNYRNRRLEGMVNIPIVGDQLDLRVAGEWTKRNGYSFNAEENTPVDGRDLWSGRVSLLVHPVENLTANLIWEHFSEDDDRLRSGKQLCRRDLGPATVDGPNGPQDVATGAFGYGAWLTQGCIPGSLYAPSAFGTPNASAFPAVAVEEDIIGDRFMQMLADPYAGVVQSTSLRVIDSLLNPTYKAKNDTLELNADYAITDALTLTSQTGYNKDWLYSTEDFNRFNTSPGLFMPSQSYSSGIIGLDGEFCDPQLGCSSRLVGEDVSQEHAWQFSQELRLASNFAGPLNFSAGANFLHYQTLEDYYVFFNVLSILAEYENGYFSPLAQHNPFDPAVANVCNPGPADPNNNGGYFGLGCSWVDPNPLGKLDGQGHNYFRSQNPYRLNSYAAFGEVYYQVAPDVKLTGGLRWTDDKKHFTEIPSWTDVVGKGYPITGIVDQQWKEWTGRFVADWTPKLDFTDQTLFYGSYSRGYKGGGANPPGPIPIIFYGIYIDSPSNATHPLTFKPEFVDAFELGTKNTLLDGAMTLNLDVFDYKYQNYQISQIVDRTSVNLNFNANVKGAEVESTWEPIPGLRFNLAGGYENATLANGSQAIDLMDRTAGHKDWLVVKPFPSQTSNCLLPTYVVNEMLVYGGLTFGCILAYSNFLGPGPIDPVTYTPYTPNPDPVNYPGYIGFNPDTAPNGGEGFDKNLSGNQLPNAPHFNTSLGAQYTMPLSENWAGTLRTDFYWQSQSYARVFNDRPYDKLRGYSNVNMTLILTSSDGWEAMAYVKNVFDTTAITGAFLNSDDTALTTNVFVTDPRLYGLRVTKTL
jgi:iron complex outermembrane recepter protein